MAADLNNLAGAIAAAGIGNDDMVIVASPASAIKLRLLSGPRFDYAVFGTPMVQDKRIIAIAASAIASAYDGIPTIERKPKPCDPFRGYQSSEHRERGRSCGRTSAVNLPARHDGHSCPLPRGLGVVAAGGVAYTDNVSWWIMDDRAREILDAACGTLDRIRVVQVEHRDYSDDPLTRCRAGMPKPEPPLTAGKIARMIADALDGYHETRAVTPKVIATVVHEVRVALRKEFADDLAKLRKLIADDRRLARNDLNSQRAEFDRRLAAQLAESAQLWAKKRRAGAAH